MRQAIWTAALVLTASAFAEDKYKAPVPGPYNCYVYEFRTNLAKPISYVTLNPDSSYKLTNGTVKGSWAYAAPSKSVTFTGGPYDGAKASFEPDRGRIVVLPKELLSKDKVAQNWGTHYCWIRDPVTGRSLH
jgi:hypothetical protein